MDFIEDIVQVRDSLGEEPPIGEEGSDWAKACDFG
jgi:hypothetical protein